MDEPPLIFGPFALDGQRHLLTREGAPIGIGQRGFALLAALARAGGRVVPKADLMDVAWPAQQVEESNLSVQIAALRKLLGPRPDGNEWIVTVARVGYQLLDSPRSDDGAETDAPAMLRQTSVPIIVVLPFQNLGSDPEQEYFSDGITEDIITDLAKISGLMVVGRSAAFDYKGQRVDAGELRRRFKARAFLEGSVRRFGNRIRLNAQLIDTVTGAHLWADRFDRDLIDVFAMQDEITGNIVRQLKVQLLPQDAGAAKVPPTSELEAYNHYLKGRYFYHLHTMQHAVMARRMFAKAVEIDPNYARAHAGLADAGSFLYALHHPDISIDDILVAAQKSLTIDPLLAEAHSAYALGLVRAGRSHEAVPHFERAIALDPNLFEAHYHYSEALYDLCEWSKAAICHERALSISPDDYRCLLMLAQMYQNLGRQEESEVTARAGVASAERALTRHPDVPLAATLGAGALAHLGERARSLEWTALALTIDPDGALTQYNAACNYAVLGEVERAIDLLERWTTEAHMGTRRWLLTDSDFDALRDRPRFKALLAQIE
jgi:adenylate cyclase